MDYTNKAIAMLKKLGDREGIGYYYRRKGNTYSKLGNYDNALKYYNISIKHIFNNTQYDIQKKNFIKFDIHQVYSYMGDFDLAIKYFFTHILLPYQYGFN